MNKKMFFTLLLNLLVLHSFSFDKKGDGNSQKKKKAHLFMQAESDTARLLRGKLKVITRTQEGERSPESVELRTGKDSIRKPLETSWLTFDIGFNNYNDRTDYAALPVATFNDRGFVSRLNNTPVADDFELRSGKSININLGIVKQQLSVYKNYVNIVYGLTYDINNWSYKQPLSWHQGDTKLMSGYGGAFVTRDSITYKKNKLVTNYLQVPLLLRFETSPRHPNRNVYFSVGGYCGYLVRSHTKQIEEGSTTKVKQHNDFNINKFQYGTQFELGYQGFSVYFKNSLSTLTQFGTKQYPYSFGCRLTGL